MAASSGRIVCPRCGANNFDTASFCWKCQSPLSGTAPIVGNPPPRAGTSEAGRAYVPPTVLAGDEGMAKRAALWLAITLPYVGLPIGWAFMMMSDNRQRQQIGKFCVLWSCVAMVFHLLLLFVGLQSLTSMLSSLPSLIHSLQGANGGGLGGN
ncbi:DUF7577 domain-containing protein [Chthonomonas calidirosea]|uniref:DUF7577 domain-containing protein n=1 Tax=Chthonomonas calidirosea TaxID=454171 RepID=UPI0006EC563C|nr:hypothetical protein [Chthonomonas calidirosea]CEK16894.1 hypothetical protein CP488_01667 [Chthonomonas calidirosea]